MLNELLYSSILLKYENLQLEIKKIEIKNIQELIPRITSKLNYLDKTQDFGNEVTI